MKHFVRFRTVRGMHATRKIVALLLIFTLLSACCLVASAEINAQIIDMPARNAEHWRVTTFSGEMPEDIASALSADGFLDYICYSGAMLEQLGGPVYRGAASNLSTFALVAIEKEGERTLLGMSRKGNEWGLCNLGAKALLPEREFTIGISDMDNASVWYHPLRFAITYPLAGGGSETYGLYANPVQTGEAPSWNIFHQLWYVSDYTKTDANGKGIVVVSQDGAFRVLSLPYDPSSEGYYPAYLPCTLEHMESILDFPTSDADAKRLAEASWARFEGTDLALAWGGVNLRQYPTMASKILAKVRTGTLVHVLGEEKGWDAPWYHVRVGHEEGFISGIYIKFPQADGFANGLSTTPLTVAKALDALTLRESPQSNASGTEFPANTLMHVLADVDDGWLYVMAPKGEIGWEMDTNGTSGYVLLSEVVQGVNSTGSREAPATILP